MGRVVRAVTLSCAVGLLTACSTPMFTMPPGPSEYRVGFQDGCDSGYAFAGSPFYVQTDVVQPPRPVEPYVSGWYAGFVDCKENFQRIQRTVFVVLGPP